MGAPRQITRKFESASPTQPTATPQTSDQDQYGSLRKWLGAGIRTVAGVGSGVLSAAPGVGTLAGAAVSGAGESLAEFAEGSEQNPARIGMEAALGAVPFGKLLGAAKGARGMVAAGRDFLAGGAGAGLGEAGRQWATGEDMNLGAIAATAGVGGTLGAGIGTGVRALADMKPSAPQGLPKVSPIEEVPIRTKGGDVMVERATPPQEGVRRFDSKESYLNDFKAAQGYQRAEGPGNPMVKTASPHRKVLGLEGRDIKPGDSEAQFNFAQDIRGAAKDQFKPIDALARAGHKANLGDMDAGIETASKMGDSQRRSTWQMALEREGFEPTTNYSASASSTNPVGSSRQSTRFVPPKESVHGSPNAGIPTETQPSDARMDELLAKLGGGTPPTHQSIAELEQLVAAARKGPQIVTPDMLRKGPLGSSEFDEVMPLEPLPAKVGDWGIDELDETMTFPPEDQIFAPLFRNRVSAMEDAYGAMKNAGNMAPESQKVAQKVLGKGLGNERKAFTNANQTGGDWVTKELNALGRGASKASPKGQTPGGSEAGFIAPELAGAAAGGLGGGLIGATEDEGPYPVGWHNRVRNAALYGGVGALAGAGGVKGVDAYKKGELGELTEKGLAALPNWQRFSYLLSMPRITENGVNPGGLLANSVGASYGAAMSGGLENALGSAIGQTGDKTGGKMLKQLGLMNFGRELKDSVPEAMRRMKEGDQGRLDYQQMGDSKFQKMTALPGLAMTTGDVASGRIAEKAGVAPKVAREMNLTNEPEHPFFKRMSDSAKGNKLGEFLFPFRRTPFNALEQGLRRIPGVGIAAQNMMRENPDAWNEQVAQQVLGAGYMGAGYLAGDNVDPETARWLRKYVTNMSGRHSLGAGLGFAMGQAHNRNESKPGNWIDKATTGLFTPQTIDTVMPLPTVEPAMDYLQMAKQALDSEPNNVKPPRGSMPPELYDLLFPRTEKVSRRLSRKF